MVTKPLSKLAGTSELGDRGNGGRRRRRRVTQVTTVFKNTKKKCVYNEIRSPFAKKNLKLLFY